MNSQLTADFHRTFQRGLLIISLVTLTLASLTSCTTHRIRQSVNKSELFSQSGFTGFMLYDPDKGKTLHAVNEHIYFIPASNTKLFTFYASYKLLGEHVNALNILEKGDSLIFWGTGDPSLLHPDLKATQALEILKNTDKKLFHANNYHQVTPNGPGWSWNWYNYYYGAERSALPIYGNIVRFSKASNSPTLEIYPSYFKRNMIPVPEVVGNQIVREQYRNLFSQPLYFGAPTTLETDKPYITSEPLMLRLLEDTLHRNIISIPYDVIKGHTPVKVQGMEMKPIYKQMMEDSDNFLAEQLMLLVSDKLFDSLNMQAAISYAKKELLGDLLDEPQWFDGSGLSSNNKFTPRSIIQLLEKIRRDVPENEIYDFFPAGGSKGTIRSWYKADEGSSPYIYAKTGTLSNSICLSGYLLTKKGKTLYFSFLHNNYSVHSDELKKEMEKILYFVHSEY